MSHCASRRCSTISHGECSAPFGRFPRSSTGRSLIACSNVACACPPVSSCTTCSRTALSLLFVLLAIPHSAFSGFHSGTRPTQHTRCLIREIHSAYPTMLDCSYLGVEARPRVKPRSLLQFQFVL